MPNGESSDYRGSTVPQAPMGPGELFKKFSDKREHLAKLNEEFKTVSHRRAEVATELLDLLQRLGDVAGQTREEIDLVLRKTENIAPPKSY